MKKILVMLAFTAALAMGATAAMAQSAPSFDNVQVSAQSHDFTGSNDVGAAVSVEKTLGSTLFVLGSVDRTYLKDAKTTDARAGIGAKFALNDGLAAYGDAYALHVGNVGFKDVKSYGYGAEAGLRDQIGNIQLSAAVNPERAVYNTGWTTYGKLGAQLDVTKSIALVADFKYHGQTDKLWNLGLAYNF